MNRSALIAALLAAGCGRPPAPLAEVEVAAAASPQTPGADAPGSPRSASATGSPQPEPSGVTFPPDPAGQALATVVAPPVPPPAADRPTGPKPRTPPARVVAPEYLPKLAAVAPPSARAAAKGAAVAPSAPPERVPVEVAVVPRATLAVRPVEVARAPDVTVPPPLPPLGRRLPDRPGLDDPTAEPAAGLVVGRAVLPAVGLSAFLRLALPDPFELAEQVRPPAVPPAADPVPVPPRRPK